jgi:hypothetical protein
MRYSLSSKGALLLSSTACSTFPPALNFRKATSISPFLNPTSPSSSSNGLYFSSSTTWRILRDITQEHDQHGPISTHYQHRKARYEEDTCVAVPTKTSYTLPSVKADMINANKKMKLAVVTAINKCDI